MQADSLGIWGWDTFEFIVHDLERSKQFFTESFGLPLIARSSDNHTSDSGENKLLFAKGGISIACITPEAKGSRAERWLRRHPDGVAIVGLRVRDLEHSYRLLAERQATFATPVIRSQDAAGNPYSYFDITTPLGDVRFRFIERPLDALPPGFQRLETDPMASLSFQSIDHVTSNMLTLEPYISWLKEVLGFKEYWRVQFHTSDSKAEQGSGLASIVMWDPDSKIKLANNEPAIPNFEASQVYTFVEDNCGAGVQHIALHVPDIQSTVGTLKQRGLNFLAVPDSYYEMLPGRLQNQNVGNFSEDLDALRRLGILVDGEDDKYLLQIFMQEAAILYDEAKAGPFFFELIQRKGATLFGEGNFRALFEAIEREQTSK
ncbi:MAG: 4-hydroxyphenylpyruvate dioxygenase family protein [Candidatus Sericytochromatia bacterium]